MEITQPYFAETQFLTSLIEFLRISVDLFLVQFAVRFQIINVLFKEIA